jgi:hypothetical protein
MSNSKQSSVVEWLFDQLEEKGGAWENASIRRVEISIDVSEYLALKEQAKAIHKEEIINAHTIGYVIGGGNGYIHEPEQYYNETYGGKK